MGCISSKHTTGASSRQGRPSRASIFPIVNSFLKIDKGKLLLQDDQRKKLLPQDGLKIDKYKVPQQDDQNEKSDSDQEEQGNCKSLLEEEPEVINVWELMEGLEDHSDTRAVSSKFAELSESRNSPGSRESSPSLISMEGSDTANTNGSPRSPLCFDSSVKRRFKPANDRSTLDSLVTSRNFSFNLMYLGDQASTPKLILDSTSPLLQKEQLRNRLIMSRELNAVAPQAENDDEEELLCTFENMLEQLSSDEWLSRRASDAESFNPQSPASLHMVKMQQDEESPATLYFTKDEAPQNVYNAMKSVLLNYGITVNKKEISSRTQAPIDSSIPLPALFINGRYIGGVERLLELDKDGQLGLLLNHNKAEQCQGCGGIRFVPCLDCNGSLRFVAEDGKLQACTECNKNGVVRCPLCS